MPIGTTPTNAPTGAGDGVAAAGTNGAADRLDGATCGGDTMRKGPKGPLRDSSQWTSFDGPGPAYGRGWFES